MGEWREEKGKSTSEGKGQNIILQNVLDVE